MNTRTLVATWIFGNVIVVAIVAVVWGYAQPINTPLRIEMTSEEVRLALTSDTAHSYSFYSDPAWCSRGLFHLGELFSYHTWIGYTFDDQSRLASAHGYHALTIELSIIGFHDHEFPMREIELKK